MFLAILLAFGLSAAATSLWALDSPLEETTASSESDAAAETTDAPDGDTLLDSQLGDSAVQPQEAEAEPTTEAPTEGETSSEPEPGEGDGGGDGGDGDGDGGSEPDEDRTTEEALLDAVNGERADAGCGALEGDAALDTAARLHAEDMAEQNYFSHTSLDGRSPTDRAADQGYSGGVGENIAAGYPDVAAVMEGWMNSEGHRANILNCDYDVIGIGVADGVEGSTYSKYWVQDFG